MQKKCYEIHTSKKLGFLIIDQWFDSIEFITFINEMLKECKSVGIIIPQINNQEEFRLPEVYRCVSTGTTINNRFLLPELYSCVFNEVAIMLPNGKMIVSFDDSIIESIIIDSNKHEKINDKKLEDQWINLINRDQVVICLNYELNNLYYDGLINSSLNYIHYNIIKPNKEQFSIKLTDSEVVLYINKLIEIYYVSVVIHDEERNLGVIEEISNITKCASTNFIYVTNDINVLRLTSRNDVSIYIKCEDL